mmetsp:Transcript_25243/g.52124  ORF Transcript_25243/g.52124 Transcript_25243/m.52124 type:complete len:273 (+) Transcript_25243:115-933(+)
MSLYVATATSRRISHRLLSSSLPISIASAPSTRHLATQGVKGSGLRRTQNKGRFHSHRSSPHLSQQPNKPNATTAASESSASEAQPPKQPTDPHSIANEMIFSAKSDARTPGTEAIASLTREQKISNYAMASGLLAFVSYVFYYSLSSVGGGENAKKVILGTDKDGKEGSVNPGFEEFLKEANEGRDEEEKRLAAEKRARGEVRELVELEETTTARLKAEGVEDVIVAASANEEEERAMAQAAGFTDDSNNSGEIKKGRPLWKKLVFFWRRE